MECLLFEISKLKERISLLEEIIQDREVRIAYLEMILERSKDKKSNNESGLVKK